MRLIFIGALLAEEKSIFVSSSELLRCRESELREDEECREPRPSPSSSSSSFVVRRTSSSSGRAKPLPGERIVNELHRAADGHRLIAFFLRHTSPGEASASACLVPGAISIGEKFSSEASGLRVRRRDISHLAGDPVTGDSAALGDAGAGETFLKRDMI